MRWVLEQIAQLQIIYSHIKALTQYNNMDHDNKKLTGCPFCMAIPIITLIGIYLAYRNSQLVRFYLRIFFFYFNILISAILCCFVTPFTYRHNMVYLIAFKIMNGLRVVCLYIKGCTAPMTLLRFFASFWLNIEVEVRGAEKIDIASGPEKKPLVLISNHQVKQLPGPFYGY